MRPRYQFVGAALGNMVIGNDHLTFDFVIEYGPARVYYECDFILETLHSDALNGKQTSGGSTTDITITIE